MEKQMEEQTTQTTQVPSKATTYSITGVINFFGTLNEKSTTKFDKVERIRFSLSDYKCEKMEELKKEFDEQVDIFKPKFVKEECEYINFKSSFEVPLYDTIGLNQISNDLITSKSDVELVVKVKEGKMYPVAIRLIKSAPKYNPFNN